MSGVLEIVLGTIAGVGGIGFVITTSVASSSKFIAERLQNKYQLKLDEELEKFKAELENKTYISKTRFDAEFLIYQNLSLSFFKCVKAFNILIPSGFANVLKDEEARKKQEERDYREAVKAYNEAQEEYGKSIPFISKELCDKYNELLRLFSLQLYDFELRWDASYLVSQKEKETLGKESYKRTDEINEKNDELNEMIRNHLERLDVI